MHNIGHRGCFATCNSRNVGTGLRGHFSVLVQLARAQLNGDHHSERFLSGKCLNKNVCYLAIEI